MEFVFKWPTPRNTYERLLSVSRHGTLIWFALGMYSTDEGISKAGTLKLSEKVAFPGLWDILSTFKDNNKALLEASWHLLKWNKY